MDHVRHSKRLGATEVSQAVDRISRSGGTPLVVAEGARADFYLNQRLREGYRAASPANPNDGKENASDASTVGATKARINPTLAVLSPRPRGDR